MNNAKLVILGIAVVGIAAGALAFKAKKGVDLTYYGCDTKKWPHTCTALKWLPNAQTSTNPSDQAIHGSIVSLPNVNCNSDADCGTIRYAIAL